MEHSLFSSETSKPFLSFGIESPLLEFNTEVIFHTWAALGVLLIFSLGCRYALRKPETILGYTVLTLFKLFKGLVEQSTAFFDPRYYFFISSLFIFIFTCNALVLIPGLEEPTRDLNTTFALALISFLYVQKEMLDAHGLLGYIKEYFKMPLTIFPAGPFTFFTIPLIFLRSIGNLCIAIFTFPLEVLGKLANVLSLSLRLFGNIFGSSIMIGMFKQATSGQQIIGLLTGLANVNIVLSIIAAPILLCVITSISLVLAFGFGVLESLIQAFVFSVLTLTYINLAIKHDT